MPSWKALGTPWEATVVERLYRDLPDTDLSRDVLASEPQTLAVLPVAGVSSSVLGIPGGRWPLERSIESPRVAETRRHG